MPTRKPKLVDIQMLELLFKILVKLFPHSGRVHLWLAQQIAPTSKARFDESREHYLHAVELGVKNPHAYTAAVSFLATDGKREQARRLAQAGLRIFPDIDTRSELLFSLMNISFLDANIEEAVGFGEQLLVIWEATEARSLPEGAADLGRMLVLASFWNDWGRNTCGTLVRPDIPLRALACYLRLIKENISLGLGLFGDVQRINEWTSTISDALRDCSKAHAVLEKVVTEIMERTARSYLRDIEKTAY